MSRMFGRCWHCGKDKRSKREELHPLALMHDDDCGRLCRGRNGSRAGLQQTPAFAHAEDRMDGSCDAWMAE